MTAIASLTAIVFILLTSMVPQYAVLWLSIEVVLLPSVYVIGSIVIERVLRRTHEDALRILYRNSKALNEKYTKLKYEYDLLKY